jgi:hypothetical protein
LRMKIRITQWVILGLLTLMIFHPVFNIKKKIPPYGILLIDKSESMQDVKEIEIESDYTIKKFYFGAEGRGTDIATAIIKAAETNPYASFIILYSDGSNTKGENPIMIAEETEIPIYFIPPEITGKTTWGFISAYGPNSIKEGDSVKITVYYKIPDTALLEIKTENQTIKENIKKEGILNFAFLPSAGKKDIRLNLLIDNDTIDRNHLSLDVRKKRKLLIISAPPDWNYKFIRRYFEDKNWEVGTNEKDNIRLHLSQNIDIICFLNDPVKYKEPLENYLEKGGKIIVISSVTSNLNFLPVIASTLTKYSGKLPESYYLKPGGIRRNSKTLPVNGENLGYTMRFAEGTVIQLIYLELWKLALSAGQLYPQNLFEELMDKSLKELISEETSIYYSNRLLEGEDFIIKFKKNENIVKELYWDRKQIKFSGDPIIVKQPSPGLHYFKINLQSHSIEDSVLVVSAPKDRLGLDTLMLKGIAAISGGGEWYKNFKKEDFELKEKEIRINLRHNWFFIISLLLLIFFDWFLWMRKNK